MQSVADAIKELAILNPDLVSTEEDWKTKIEIIDAIKEAQVVWHNKRAEPTDVSKHMRQVRQALQRGSGAKSGIQEPTPDGESGSNGRVVPSSEPEGSTGGDGEWRKRAGLWSRRSR